MTGLSRRVLYWSPRLLSITFVLFLSLFAFDALEEDRSFWSNLLALAMHLVPCFVLTLALILAWRWEWIGAVMFASAGLLYVGWVVSMDRPVPAPMRLVWILTIAGPALLVAALFLVNWLRRGELRMGR